MTFEEWLYGKSKVTENRDVRHKFASVVMTGQLALGWRAFVQTLDDVLQIIEVAGLSDERRGELKFAARAVWESYQIEKECDGMTYEELKQRAEQEGMNIEMLPNGTARLMRNEQVVAEVKIGEDDGQVES